MENKHIVFFGNEKLSTGLENVKPIILEALSAAGFVIEQHVTGPISSLRPHKAKIAVLAAYGHIVPQNVLDEFPLGIINVHPSLLPIYRGSTPIEQAILDGATKTGVSIMLLAAGMDEGPLYKQKSIALDSQVTKAELTQKLQELGSELILEVLPEIASGKLKPRQQPHPERATFTKRISKEDGRIDWTKPAVQIEREIRAYDGWPRSYATIGGIDVVITKAHIAPGGDEKPGYVEIDDDLHLLTVNTRDGYLCIDKLIPAGKKEMPASAFLAGYKDRLQAA